jgi:hypothetical protein
MASSPARQQDTEPEDEPEVAYFHFDLRLIQGGNRDDDVRTRHGNAINAHMLQHSKIDAIKRSS